MSAATPRVAPGASDGRRIGIAVGALVLAVALLVGAAIVRQTGVLSAPSTDSQGVTVSVGGYTGIPYTPSRSLGAAVGGYTGIPYTPTRQPGPERRWLHRHPVHADPAAPERRWLHRHPVHPDPAAPERRWLHRHPVHPDACRGAGAAPRPPRWIGCLGWRGRLEPPAHGAVTALAHPASPGTSTRQPRGAVARRDGAFRCVPARACHVSGGSLNADRSRSVFD